MDELRRLSLNQATIPSWSLPEAADGCAKAGLGWIGVWRDRLAEVGIAAATRSIRDAGIGVSSLLRGGFFDASESTARRRHMDGNRRAVEEAAELHAQTLVLVCGPAAGRDLEGARAYIAEAIAELRDFAAPCGVALGIEPMHPVYCADRSAVVTLRQALALAAPHPQAEVGVVIDAYHVWWDPDLRAEVAAARGRIQGYHVCDWLVPPPDHLNGRGMMGDGVIDLRGLRRMVDEAGYDGPIEAEIFNPTVWALAGNEALDLVCRRYLEHVVA
ncbi:MAG TPA: sugar phosphate isomerase/epimerase family protein [Candidatus Dormibacteraeota bacterium]|nr:sugar phosphate isomerase/epimerase family protein [Candidatus Dormibacteraeota bacterium]